MPGNSFNKVEIWTVRYLEWGCFLGRSCPLILLNNMKLLYAAVVFQVPQSHATIQTTLHVKLWLSFHSLSKSVTQLWRVLASIHFIFSSVTQCIIISFSVVFGHTNITDLLSAECSLASLNIHVQDKPNWGSVDFCHPLPSCHSYLISGNIHWVCVVDMICIAAAQILGSAKPLNNPITCALFTISEHVLYFYPWIMHDHCMVLLIHFIIIVLSGMNSVMCVSMFDSLVWLMCAPEIGTFTCRWRQFYK